MAFLLYFVVIVVSAASVMFGLDLATSPLSPPPNVLIGRAAHVAPAPGSGLAQERDKHPEQVTKTARAASARTLSPIRPASPKVAKPERQAADTAAKAATDTWLPPAPRKAQVDAPPLDRQDASALQPKTAQLNMPDDQASTAHAPDDSTPKQTELRVCPRNRQWPRIIRVATSLPAARPTIRSAPPTAPISLMMVSVGCAPAPVVRPWPRPTPERARPAPKAISDASGPNDGHELDEVTRIVRQMTPGDADVPVRRADGSIVIVHTGAARAQASCDVSACARRYNSFRASDCTYQPFGGPRRLCTR